MKTIHSDRQVENTTAPLRLCARLSGWECGKRLTFSDAPLLSKRAYAQLCLGGG